MRLQDVQRKARYGHRDWIVWDDADGVQHSERATEESIKDALLSVGTQGQFTIVSANTGWLMIGKWFIGINMMNWMKRGGPF